MHVLHTLISVPKIDTVVIAVSYVQDEVDMTSFPFKNTLRRFSVYTVPAIEAGAVPKFLEKFTRLEWLHLAESNRVSPL